LSGVQVPLLQSCPSGQAGEQVPEAEMQIPLAAQTAPVLQSVSPVQRPRSVGEQPSASQAKSAGAANRHLARGEVTKA